MNIKINFKVNENIFLKDPESSEVGKQIIKQSINLINLLGYEQFTFKKLATDIGTTEATIYRYFENKQRLLLYIIHWYWCYMEFLLMFKLHNVHAVKDKLKVIVELFAKELPDDTTLHDYDRKALSQIVIVESSKVYLNKEVSSINENEVFKPYKDLCATIAAVIKEYNPKYKFPRSLSSTIIEACHQQQFFSNNLPRLTDVTAKENANFTYQFVLDLLFKVLA